MKRVYPVIFTQLNDEKNTVLIEVPDLEILTEGLGWLMLWKWQEMQLD